MSKGVGEKTGRTEPGLRSLLGLCGRVAIWVLIGLLLVKGVGGVLVPPSRSDTGAAGARSQGGPSEASASFAVRFARAFLRDPSQRALASFLAEGARVGKGQPPLGRGSEVAQAEVAAAKELGGGGEVLTVACELRDARTLYLAVPIFRSEAGEVAALGAPWVVAVPSKAGVVAERPRPLAGPDAEAIEALAEKFLPAYVSARSPRTLSYLLAPGAQVVPLAGAVELLGAPGVVSQIGDGEGGRRTVVVAGRFRDPASAAVYKLAYRLRLIKQGRWYVRGVEGAFS